jgi:putative salt-induced outer membrane protein YdiY
MPFFKFLSILSLLIAIPATSEVVQFKNGDRLTGTLEKMSDGKLVLKSDTVGEVTIPLSKVESFESEKPVVVVVDGGQKVVANVGYVPTGSWVVTRDGRSDMLADKRVMAILPPDPRTLARDEGLSAIVHNWNGTANFGYSLVRGDRNAGTFSVALDGTRQQFLHVESLNRWRTHYSLAMLLASSSTSDASGVSQGANSFTSSIRQDYLFTPSNFVFGVAQADHIDAQSLDLRQTYGIGMGRDLLRGPKLGLSLLAGSTYVTDQLQTGENDSNAEALIGGKFHMSFLQRNKFVNVFNVYPNLTMPGEYRFDTTSTLSTAITSKVSLNVNVLDRFLSTPLPGHARNDLVLTTGFGLHL